MLDPQVVATWQPKLCLLLCCRLPQVPWCLQVQYDSTLQVSVMFLEWFACSYVSPCAAVRRMIGKHRC